MIQKLKSLIKSARIYWFDFINDIRHTTLIVDKYSSQEMLLSSLVVASHTIEKGLTMPRKRFPFGESKAMEIALDSRMYINRGYDTTDKRFLNVLSIMQEYADMNSHNGHGINKSLEELIKTLVEEVSLKEIAVQHYSVNKEDYFSNTHNDFLSFSASRYSCRNLPGHVPAETLNSALALSMNTPSTCNRQSHRIHLLQTASAKSIILNIQSGNRGFGDIADQFILVTSDLHDWPGMHQRHAPYVDGGIFVMNLLYCLHYYGIGACTLNLYLDSRKTRNMHRQLNIPDNEVPIALIAIGIPPEEFDLARSYRKKSDEIIVTH